MITYSIIKKSQLEGARRLDAEYYQPEYLRVDQMVSRDGFVTIQKLGAKVFSGPFGSTLKSESYQTEGVPFIRISNISDIFIQKDNDLVYISPDEHKRIYDTHLKTGDIVFSKIGTVGRLSIISDEFGEVNISENNIGLRLTDLPAKERIYLLLFLLSRYGQSQIVRRASGNIQLKLNVSDIKSVKIPEVDNGQKESLVKIYDEILILRQKSESLYSQAEQVLLEELGLRDFSIEDGMWSVVKFSEVKNAERMDAEYFEPRYHILENKLKKYGVESFTQIIQEVPAKFDAKTKADQKFNYVELSNINAAIGMIEGSSEVLGKEAPSRARRVLKTGDVIVSSIEGSLGKVALVDSAQDGNLASTGFFQFRSKEILPEALLMLAKSIVFNWQLQQRTAGTILTAVPGESLKSVLVPVLPKPTQQKIAELARQSHAARKRAKELLEEAKRAVERLIEERR